MGDWTVCLTTRLWRGGTILFLVLITALPMDVTAQSVPHRAGVVVRFGDGSAITRCVSFAEPTISGIELLTRAALSIVVDTRSSIGAGVCKIEREGCDRGKSCFCQCEGSTCAYWQYFHLQGGAWKYSNLGAALYQVADGAVEGWAWGNNVAPPVMSLDQICTASQTGAVPAATRIPQSTPTAAPRSVTPTASVIAMLVTIPAMSTTAPTVVPATAVSAGIALPTALLLPSPTLAPTVAASPASNFSSLISYVVFGVIILGLGVWLVVQARRRAR